MGLFEYLLVHTAGNVPGLGLGLELGEISNVCYVPWNLLGSFSGCCQPAKIVYISMIVRG